MNKNQESVGYLIDVATGTIQKTIFKNAEECWEDLMEFVNRNDDDKGEQQ